jgi:glutamate decarboxylase
MVHLAAIPTNDKLAPPSVAGVSLKSIKEDVDNNLNVSDETFTTTVYGSKYAALDLPKYEMPEEEMPREVAYRMIKYYLSPNQITN